MAALSTKYVSEYVSSLDLSTHARTVALFGGSNGIGEGVARKLASLGCRIIILGRDEINVDNMKREAKAMKPRGEMAEISFIKVDLLTESGMKDAVKKLKEEVGLHALDCTMLFQNGRPTGKVELTSDGILRMLIHDPYLRHEKGYAVQSLSRFVIFSLTR
ncbi:hypothetical protein BD324DRAFT_344219 [Kockovaella imperatae]|uniref:Uncharacterized protein n=1 Tax=Kockovaella imperatae TaxID=4999 RepID=A0A1Y1UJL2_9TREE|nr:hypothetical protein BD324DRAFT_344219 [Kockovaella imperatae]ORX38238.1 hypothetical protein BD324DRAFT_344219 [Kockovaella imperatae]